jgi:D-3-phosphoglycerate dehydrogenase
MAQASMTTSKPIFSVLRLNLPLDAETFDGLIRSHPNMSLQVLSSQGEDQAVRLAMATMHAYHVSSAKDDLPDVWRVNEALLQGSPHLLAVSTYGAGYDTVDVPACTRAGVCVFNQTGSNARAVAEHTLGMMLGLAKRLTEADRRLRRGDHFARAEGMGFELHGRTLGLVGIGYIGTLVAQLARAFGMTVIAHDPFLTAQTIEERGAQSVPLSQLLAQSDVVSVHCPRDEQTLGMFNKSAFAAMKPGALFVTTARGGIHDEAALYDALSSGHLRGAGLDVWVIEPPAASHPLLSLDQVIATHHTAGVSKDARVKMATMAATQLAQMALGAPPSRLINSEVWPEFAKRFEQRMGRPAAPLNPAQSLAPDN